MKIGFIGLGLMGLPMALNLQRAGANLVVTTRTMSKVQSLASEGVVLADTPVELSAKVGDGIIVVCVADTPALRSVIEGEVGVFSGLNRGALIIDMGTSDVDVTRTLAARADELGASYVDAPVSGGEVGATEASLSIMAGGTEDDLNRAAPVFATLGSSVTHIGPVGAGQITKAANQIVVAATLSIVAEALALARAGGADIAAVRQALLGGFAASRILDLHGQRMVDGRFEPGGRARTQLKDLRQATGLARSLDLSLPVLERTTEQWKKMVDSGRGDLDQSGYFDFVVEESMAHEDR